jgi:hypothetical protein
VAFEEKRAWMQALVAVVAYGGYAALVLGRAGGTPLAEVHYARPLLVSLVGAVLAGVAVSLALAATSSGGAGERDARDREIHLRGEHVGQAFLVLGGVAALGMALAEWPPFWIANAVYLAFALAAVVASVTKIVCYRRGVPQW